MCYGGESSREVWNIDFSESSLEIGLENARLNQCEKPEFITIKTDVFSALRQFTNTPYKGRNAINKPEVILEEHGFDLVFLDPPAWAKSPFGTVDLVRDYQSIFKLALKAINPRGRVIAVNNVSQVQLEDWLEILRRCATKCGRPLKSIEVLEPENDFPSWDRKFPLKIAVCEI